MSKKEKQFKHLGFLRDVMLLTWAWTLKLYEFFKRKLPLFGSVMSAAETSTPTTTILVPLYDKLTNASYHLLVFADRKLVTLVVMAGKRVPVSVMVIVKLTQHGAKKLLVKLRRFGRRPSLSVPNFFKKASGTGEVASPLRETVSLPIVGGAVNRVLASGVVKKLSSSKDSVISKRLRALPLRETVSVPIVGSVVNKFLANGVVQKLSSSPNSVISKRLRSWTSAVDGEVKDDTGHKNTLN